MGTKEAIVQAAAAVLAAGGIRKLTISRVARQARISSALVHYHFATKGRLLVAVSTQLAAERTRLRVSALEAGEGLGALDLLWANLSRGSAAAAERAWHDLLLLAREDEGVRRLLAAERERELALVARALPRLLAAMGARPLVPAEDLAAAVCTCLDGVAVGLASGTRAAEVRAAYDAFWLVVVAPGQPGGR